MLGESWPLLVAFALFALFLRIVNLALAALARMASASEAVARSLEQIEVVLKSKS